MFFLIISAFSTCSLPWVLSCLLSGEPPSVFLPGLASPHGRARCCGASIGSPAGLGHCTVFGLWDLDDFGSKVWISLDDLDVS